VVSDWVEGLGNVIAELERSSEVPLLDMPTEQLEEALHEALPGIESVLNVALIPDLLPAERNQTFADAARQI